MYINALWLEKRRLQIGMNKKEFAARLGITYRGYQHILKTNRCRSAITITRKAKLPHRQWACDFAAAFLLYLQGDSSEIDRLARDMRIIFDHDGIPQLKSAILAKIEEEL